MSEVFELLKGFTAGAVAACGAVTLTNPAEVVKVRLQLQGELQQKVAKNANFALGRGKGKLYGSAVSTFMSILKNEGIRGIQRGLGAAYCYQIILNGFRYAIHLIQNFISPTSGY